MASTKARIGFVFGRLGIVPEAASSWFLPRIVGIQQALEWVYSADILTAEQALAGRLLRSVHEPDDLLPAAYDLARSFVVDRSPVALGLAKQLLYRNGAAADPLEAHLSDSLAMYYTSIGDGKEGVAAFREKREPRFTGRASRAAATSSGPEDDDDPDPEGAPGSGSGSCRRTDRRGRGLGHVGLEPLAQPREQSGQQPRDLHLGDADLGADLGLRGATEEAHLEDPSLARGEVA